MIPDASSPDRRLLFLPATAKDGATTQVMLSSFGIRVDVCSTFKALLHEVGQGVGAVLLPDEVVSSAHITALRAVLDSEPPWSDLPLLVLTRPGADSVESGEAARTLGNVTLLERPIRVATLLSAVRTALRARERQYQIREHLAERARAEKALQLADERKDEFLATLGHELRNPLAPLLAAVQLLKTAGTQDPVVLRASGVMDRQISHLMRLVNDLLEVSRITRGLVELQRQPLDLGFVVQAAIDTSRPYLDAAAHQLTVEMPAEPVTVYGDVLRLTQVFTNLLTNAAKYTDTGGHIRVRIRQEGPRALISVRDNGIGIAADHLPFVFDMFTQVDRSSRRAQGGLGIGLTLVRSLVGIHDGRVEARSDGPGRGSEFVVELPIHTERAEDALRLSTWMPPDDFPRRRILIVDDNHDAADSLGELLNALGAIVSVAYGGPDALEKLEAFAPDAVLLDIGMPGMDGYEVARRIRSTADHGNVLLIALTGWGQDHDRQRARASGFDEHVVKPPDLNRLRDLLAAGSLNRPEERGPGPSLRPEA